MKKLKGWVSCIVCLIVLMVMCFSVNALHREGKEDSIPPQLNDGEKWKIAYVLFNESSTYVNAFDNLLKGLIDSGWLKVDHEALVAYPENAATESQTIDLWKWVKKYESSYLDFVVSYYPPSDITDLDQYARKVATELKEKHIDLAIVMGDVAAKKLLAAGCETKMMILETSDPVALAMVNQAKVSGKEHVWAHVDNKQYENQIRIFYDTFPFKKLGVVYDDKREVKSDDAKLRAIQKVAEEKKFEVIYRTLSDQNTEDDFETRAKAVYSELAKKVDAVYLTQYQCDNDIDLESLLLPFYEEHVLTFSEVAANVHKGMLMSATNLEDEGSQMFYEKTFSRLLVTDDMSEIKQEFVMPPQIILNLDVAKKIEQKIDFELILAADQIIQKTEE